MIRTYEEAKAANEAAGQFFYTERTKGSFGLRMLEHTYPVDNGAFVIASVRRDRAAKRRYEVRFISSATGKLHMLDNVESRDASFGAQSVARTLADTWQHGCQICRAVGHGPHEPCKE